MKIVKRNASNAEIIICKTNIRALISTIWDVSFVINCTSSDWMGRTFCGHEVLYCGPAIRTEFYLKFDLLGYNTVNGV